MTTTSDDAAPGTGSVAGTAGTGTADTGTAGTAPRAARDVPRRGTAAVVVVVFLAVSAVASALLAAAQSATGLPTDVLALTQLATAVGALVVWLGWRARLVLPPVRRRGWRRPLLESAAVTVAVAGALGVAQAVAGAWPPLDPSTLGAPLVVVLVAQLLGAAGEEVGWRGLVQPLLETRVPVPVAGVATGLLFGLGHVHVLAAGTGVYALFVVSAVGLSVALAYVTAGRGVVQRVVVATALHWLVNVVLLVGFSGGDTSVGWTAATAVATLSGAAVAAVLHRRRGRAPRD